MNLMKCLPVLICLVSTRFVKAQQSSSIQVLLDERCKHHYTSLQPAEIKDKEKARFPFKTIEVADYRADSVRSGFFSSHGQQYDLLFKSGTGRAISSFLNEDYTNPSATRTLLVVIKRLWVSDVVYKDQPSDIPQTFGSQISFRAETYVKESAGYIPLTFFDTLIVSNKNAAEIIPFRLPALITRFAEKINSLDVNATVSRATRVVSYTFIDSFSNKIFLHPMDMVDTLQKGVYASFEEFKNNRPSIFDYEVKQEDNSLMALHLRDEQGKAYYSRKMWGYCDGQQIYVMMDGNLFPTFPYNRAYYVFGSKDYQVKKSSVPIIFLLSPVVAVAVGPMVPVSETVFRKLHFFKLDMESGEIY